MVISSAPPTPLSHSTTPFPPISHKMSPIPTNIKEIFAKLESADSIALRSYISGLRSEIKELEKAAAAPGDGHYHDGEYCTADHSHDHAHDRWVICCICCFLWVY